MHFCVFTPECPQGLKKYSKLINQFRGSYIYIFTIFFKEVNREKFSCKWLVDKELEPWMRAVSRSAFMCKIFDRCVVNSYLFSASEMPKPSLLFEIFNFLSISTFTV